MLRPTFTSVPKEMPLLAIQPLIAQNPPNLADTDVSGHVEINWASQQGPCSGQGCVSSEPNPATETLVHCEKLDFRKGFHKPRASAKPSTCFREHKATWTQETSLFADSLALSQPLKLTAARLGRRNFQRTATGSSPGHMLPFARPPRGHFSVECTTHCSDEVVSMQDPIVDAPSIEKWSSLDRCRVLFRSAKAPMRTPIDVCLHRAMRVNPPPPSQTLNPKP